MSAFFSSVFDAMTQRIRSPILGSILLAHIAWNWSAYFYLFWAETLVPVRIAYFKMNTDVLSLLVYPIGLVFMIAILSPYIRYVGAKCAKFPDGLIRELQDDQASNRRVNNLKRQAKEDSQKREIEIEKAKQLKVAEEVGGSELVDKIETSTVDPFYLELNKILTEPQQHFFQLLYLVGKGGEIDQRNYFSSEEVGADSIYLTQCKNVFSTRYNSESDESVKEAFKIYLANDLIQNVSERGNPSIFKFTDSGRSYGEYVKGKEFNSKKASTKESYVKDGALIF